MNAASASRASLARRIVTLAVRLEALERKSRTDGNLTDDEWVAAWKASKEYSATLAELLEAARAYAAG